MNDDERTRLEAEQDMQAALADATERLKHQMELAKATIQSLTLVNGGAIVALFTLIGKQGDRSLPADRPVRFWAWQSMAADALLASLHNHLR